MLSISSAASDLLLLTRARTESLVPPDPTVLRHLFAKYSNPGNDPAAFDVLEQIFLASIDNGDTPTARTALEKVQARFPASESRRSRRLQAMLAEHLGEHERAVETYREMLRASDGGDSDVQVRKRLVAALLAQPRKRYEATAELANYCDTFAGDAEAWATLSGVYLEEGMQAQAQYAAEECVLLEPGSAPAHLRLADILYTREDHQGALKYYCRALEVSPGSARALYGIRQAAGTLIEAQKGKRGGGGGDSETKSANAAVWADLVDMATAKLVAFYDGIEGPQSVTARKWLK
ncbi:TPR-like protein [Gonapodya prolifera JEL478]|uniref:ER membrane protein complex subunit 2 n=1 Tax=Gonapodya prolifera (strain JEL478) TaxID=1344416 RepID=A0A139AWM4_GONPJ|nr:TPR-like protein [Gonapodya prolifera JEL478]|eukprot:KXS20983.1 TPR-like protein [Gonapodya prolifera JEL478]